MPPACGNAVVKSVPVPTYSNVCPLALITLRMRNTQGESLGIATKYGLATVIVQVSPTNAVTSQISLTVAPSSKLIAWFTVGCSARPFKFIILPL